MSRSHLPSETPSRPRPPEAWAPLVRLARIATRPLERFLGIEAASGILLMAATAVALFFANSAWSGAYTRFWETPIGVHFGPFAFERSLSWWVNDGLMVIFFFVVGLEIRREIDRGELSDRRRAALPVAAALGGMIVPACLYLALTHEPSTRAGWGAAMATDIAFAVGVLTLLGKRAPPSLRILLLAVAVIDDVGAIAVIALFYSSGLSLTGGGVALFGFLLVLALQRFGVRGRLAYFLPALVAWAGTYALGVHPTIAGVLLGLMTPVRAWLGAEGFVRDVKGEIELIERQPSDVNAHELSRHLRGVSAARREALSPAEGLIEALHPWVAFGVMPVFALANAGVSFSGFEPGAATTSVAGGIALALVFGKPVGIALAIALALRLGVAELPRDLGRRHLLVLGVVAGIGFTMSLFIAQLAFADAHLLAAAKLGVLAASGLAGTLALVMGRLLLDETTPGPADDAERATS
jgi:NhaA family Na+:H+ antiporter